MRLLLRSALAGSAVAVLLVLLLHWPTSDSESELRLVQVFALAPFPLSMAAAAVARLPCRPLVGLLAPFAMLALAVVQPDYGAWVPSRNLTFYLVIAVPAVAGFIPAALLCAWLFGGKPAGTPQGDSELRA
ncbi:hypothetical protein ACWDA3_26255 [Nonomuraea rubra]